MRVSPVWVAILSVATALAGVSQVWAGPLPSSPLEEKMATGAGSPSRAGDLTAQQEVALAAVGGLDDARYGNLTHESQIIIVATVCIVAVVVIVAVAT